MNRKKKETSLFKGVIIFICAGIIPFIVRMQDVKTRASEFGVVRSAQMIRDTFSYYKMTFLIILGFVLALYSLMDLAKPDLKNTMKKPVFLLPSVFILLSFISALFSKYKDVAFYGATERYEGFWVWAVYMLLFVSTLTYVKDKKKLYIILGGLACGAVLVGMTGFLQFIGHNPYENKMVIKAVMGKYYSEGKTLGIRFSSVFSTLYNPNCVGIYTGMLFPFFLFSGIFAPIKKWYKYVLLGISVILLCDLFGCESLGGFLGTAAGLAFSAIICIAFFIKGSGKAKIVVPVLTVAVLALSAFAVFTGGSIMAQKINAIKTVMNDPNSAESPFFFEDLTIEGDSAEIKTKTGVIVITAKNSDWSAGFIPEGQELPYKLETTAVQPLKEGYSGSFALTVPGLIESRINNVGNGIIEFTGGDAKSSSTSFYFLIEGDTITALDMFGQHLDLDKQYKSIGFKGMERLGSNRGYIWSRSIPLISENIIIGAGPDCYVFKFPQQDIVSKLNYLGNPNVIIDKPHNFYLQTAINTGLISLIVLLCLFAFYIFDTVKSIFTDRDELFITGLRLGALAGVIGYLGAVLTTDSVVSVSPVFWILLGFGFAVNRKIAGE